MAEGYEMEINVPRGLATTFPYVSFALTMAGLFICVLFMLVVLNLVVSSSAVDCLGSLISIK